MIFLTAVGVLPWCGAVLAALEDMKWKKIHSWPSKTFLKIRVRGAIEFFRGGPTFLSEAVGWILSSVCRVGALVDAGRDCLSQHHGVGCSLWLLGVICTSSSTWTQLFSSSLVQCIHLLYGNKMICLYFRLFHLRCLHILQQNFTEL